MLGLISKDLRLIRNSGIVMLLLFLGVMGAFMLYTMDNPSGFVSYATIMGSIYAFNTISYDNYANGYAFLFTLPISPKLYAVEKYVLSLLLSGGSCLAAAILAGVLKGGPDPTVHCISSLLIWIVQLWMPIVMLPLQLRFGAEKSRIFTIILFGGCAVLFYLAVKTDILETVLGFFNSLLDTLGAGGLAALAMLCTAAAGGLSVLVSMYIMERKEF